MLPARRDTVELVALERIVSTDIYKCVVFRPLQCRVACIMYAS